REMSGLQGTPGFQRGIRTMMARSPSGRRPAAPASPLLNDLRVASNEPPGFQHLASHLGRHTISYSLVLSGLRPAIRSEVRILVGYQWTNAQSDNKLRITRG